MGLLLLCVFCAGHADQGVKHVDLSGKIYLSYLHECSNPHSDLVVLFRSFITFGIKIFLPLCPISLRSELYLTAMVLVQNCCYGAGTLHR